MPGACLLTAVEPGPVAHMHPQVRSGAHERGAVADWAILPAAVFAFPDAGLPASPTPAPGRPLGNDPGQGMAITANTCRRANSWAQILHLPSDCVSANPLFWAHSHAHWATGRHAPIDIGRRRAPGSCREPIPDAARQEPANAPNRIFRTIGQGTPHAALRLP